MNEERDRLCNAIDELAWAWLECRDGGESKAAAEELVSKILVDKKPISLGVPAPPLELPVKPEQVTKLEEYTSQQAADLLGHRPSDSSLVHWAQEGILQFRKVGRAYMFPAREVERLRSLKQAAPSRYKNPTFYIAKVLRVEAHGSPHVRPIYDSEREYYRKRDEKMGYVPRGE